MGGKNQTTQTSTNSPYPGSVPLLNAGMTGAMNQYQNGGLVKPNTQSMVVPWSQDTMAGMGSMRSNAQAGMAPGGYASQWGDIIGGGGFNGAQKTAMDGIKNTATGAFDINSNPAFQSVLGQAQDAAKGAVNQQAAGLGRMNSGTHQGVMAKEVGDLTSRMVGDEYRNWQGRSDAAQRDLFNMGQQGQSNLSTAYQNQMDPSRTMMELGGMNEDLYRRTLDDRSRITGELQNLPFANLQALLGLAGAGAPYSTQTATAQGPSNTASNILGGAYGGASILQMLRGL